MRGLHLVSPAHEVPPPTPPTDASDDSVEIHVSPVSPRRHLRQRPSSPLSAPLDFSVTSLAHPHVSRPPPSPPRTPTPSLSPSRSRCAQRKSADPRRYTADRGQKRSLSEDENPRKVLKVEEELSSEIPHAAFLGAPHPFLSPLIPPHLLFPHAWSPLARFHPYAPLVGVGNALAPHLGGLISPSPYHLLPILGAGAAGLSVPSPTHGHNSEDQKFTKKEVSSTNRPHKFYSGETSVRWPPKGANGKFLSVESMLSPPLDRPRPARSPSSSPVAGPSEATSSRLPVRSSSPHLPAESPARSIRPTPLPLSSRAESPPRQRNYKNMTRERRIEANARERTRVHTISAAFDTLRSTVPSFSHSQKLSKLSVLRIASSYILALAKLTGHDYSSDGLDCTADGQGGKGSMAFADCVDLTTKTIQVEGKAKKKRDDS